MRKIKEVRARLAQRYHEYHMLNTNPKLTPEMLDAALALAEELEWVLDDKDCIRK